jgi:NADH:ubiquinone reductase (H+-translocating)
MPPRVVCLGGGHTAATIAPGLRRAIRRGLLDVTFVNRDNFQVFHGFVHEMLCAKVQPSHIASPARRIFSPARFHNAEVGKIDLAAGTVTTSRRLDGREHVLAYDHLIIALGSIDDLSRYAGTAEHAQKLKTYWDCLKARSHILDMLEMAEIERNPVERERLLTFVIVGGNFGGVEVATELQDYLRALTQREYPGIRPNEIRVILVHNGNRILPELREHHEPLITWAERHLGGSGIDIRLNTRVRAATPEEIVLSGDERVLSRTIISCAGTARHPLIEALDVKRDERGRIVVDEFLRVVGWDNVWAGGDCAAVPHPKGGICPPLAIYARTAGRLIAKNIVHAVEGRPLKRYQFTGLGDACTIGRRRAVGHFKGIRLTGLLAWLTWRVMLLKYVAGFDRKVRLVIDWILWPLIGRDITNIRSEESYGVRREHYEPGQEIVRQGEVGRRLFILWKGEVDVIRESASGPQLLATLGPGQHFGEAAVFEQVRRTATVCARTEVEVLAVGQVEAIALTAIRSFGETVRRTPTLAAYSGDATEDQGEPREEN